MSCEGAQWTRIMNITILVPHVPYVRLIIFGLKLAQDVPSPQTGLLLLSATSARRQQHQSSCFGFRVAACIFPAVDAQQKMHPVTRKCWYHTVDITAAMQNLMTHKGVEPIRDGSCVKLPFFKDFLCPGTFCLFSGDEGCDVEHVGQIIITANQGESEVHLNTFHPP